MALSGNLKVPSLHDTPAAYRKQARKAERESVIAYKKGDERLSFRLARLAEYFWAISRQDESPALGKV